MRERNVEALGTKGVGGGIREEAICVLRWRARWRGGWLREGARKVGRVRVFVMGFRVIMMSVLQGESECCLYGTGPPR